MTSHIFYELTQQKSQLLEEMRINMSFDALVILFFADKIFDFVFGPKIFSSEKSKVAKNQSQTFSLRS